MTYNTLPRTRQAVYGTTMFFGGGLLWVTAWRWMQTQHRGDLLIGLWVLGVAWVTFKILRGLERLERQRSQPDEAMELLLYAASTLQLAGYLPALFYLVWQ